MIPLNENGSLDIESINKLPIEVYINIIGNMSNQQYREYLASTSINENRNQTKAVRFHSVKYIIEQGIGEDAVDFLNKMKETYLKK